MTRIDTYNQAEIEALLAKQLDCPVNCVHVYIEPTSVEYGVSEHTENQIQCKVTTDTSLKSDSYSNR